MTWTPQAGASVIDTDSKFGAGCLDLKSASGSRLETTYDSAFDFGTQSFTIEGFVKLKPGGWGGFICHRLYSSYGWAFGCYPDRSIAFRANIGGVWSDNYGRSAAGVLLTDTWHHVALCRDGSNWRLFVDGVIVGTFTNAGALYNASTLIRYGVSQIDGTVEWPLDGKLDEWRITKGVARYTSNFSPPLVEFPYVQDGAVVDPEWEDVVLMMPFDGFAGSRVYTDECGAIWSSHGTGDRLSTTGYRWGGSSLEFQTSSVNYLSTPASTKWHFAANDFTIETWFHATVGTSGPAIYRTILGCDDVAVPNNRGWLLLIDGDFGGKLVFAIRSGTVAAVVMSPSAIQLNRWYHVAIVRNGAMLRMYLDGIEVASSAIAGTTNDAGVPLYIGSLKSGAGMSTSTFAGYIDQMRITNGTCRYPDGTTFTPTVALRYAEMPVPTVTSRFYRVLITQRSNSGSGTTASGYMNIAIKLLSANADNVADEAGSLVAGATASVSSLYQGDATWAAGAFSTGPHAFWHSAVVAGPWWAMIDFGAGNSVSVASITITPKNTLPETRTPYEFYLQTSNDGVTWTNVLFKTGITGWVVDAPITWFIGG